MSYIGRMNKGGFLVGTGLGNVELPVGANGTRLEADSTQPDGVKWSPQSPGIKSWINNTSGSAVSMAVNTGYIANNQGNVITYTLPATSAVGDEIRLVSAGATGGYAIAQGAGQQIQFGTSNTTLGVTGGLVYSTGGDCLHLLCIVANTTWQVIDWVGAPNLS